MSSNDSTAIAYDILYGKENNTKEELMFIRNFIKPGDNILDIGCGTGRHFVPLQQEGYTMTGVDPSLGMLDILRLKTQSGTIVNKSFLAAEFRNEFDLMICFYNVFAELAKTKKEAQDAATKMHFYLNSSGTVIIQVSNPDHIDLEHFEYRNQVNQNGREYKVHYYTIKSENNLTICQEDITINGKKLRAEIRQYWWTSIELQNTFEEVGFTVKLLGDNFEPFKAKSKNIIVVAQKNG